MTNDNNDYDDGYNETRRELIGVYLPAALLLVWAAIVAMFGFDNKPVNILMMLIVAASVFHAETIRRRRDRRRRTIREKRREHGPVAN